MTVRDKLSSRHYSPIAQSKWTGKPIGNRWKDDCISSSGFVHEIQTVSANYDDHPLDFLVSFLIPKFSPVLKIGDRESPVLSVWHLFCPSCPHKRRNVLSMEGVPLPCLCPWQYAQNSAPCATLPIFLLPQDKLFDGCFIYQGSSPSFC
jgi:hypothetical protein